MEKQYNVFNLSESPYLLVLEDASYQIAGRQWRVTPEELAMRLCDNRDMFVDFGGGSFSDSTLPFDDGRQKSVHFAGVLETITGYGNATYPIVLDLHKRQDVNLTLSRTGRWGKDHLPHEVQALMDEAEAPHIPYYPRMGEWSFKNPPPVVDRNRPMPARWGIALTVPPELPKVPTPRKLLYTMAEGSAIPNGSHNNTDWQADGNAWVAHINAYADVLAVPCREMKTVFEASGIYQEAHVVPLGCSFDQFEYKPRTAERPPLFAGENTPRREKRDVFTLVIDGHLSARKAPSLSLLEVVYPALDQFEDWHLVIKCRAGESGLLSGIKDSRVTVVANDFTPKQMAELFQYADVGLCLSLYEGWGMTFREMMATGLPVIVSDSSGHREDADPDYNYPVPVKEREVINDYYGLVAYRDLPDWEVARGCLLAEYRDWKRRGGVQSPLGESAARWIRGRRQWTSTTDALLELVSNADATNFRRRGKRLHDLPRPIDTRQTAAQPV